MNPIDFLRLANRLHTSTPGEAELRTSISRSYYATFHLLNQSLSAQGVVFARRGDDHGLLIHYLAHSGDPKTQKIGRNLGHLRSARGRADYDLGRSIDGPQSQLAYQTAERAISLFNTISSSGDFPNIVNAIKASPPYAHPK